MSSDQIGQLVVLGLIALLVGVLPVGALIIYLVRRRRRMAFAMTDTCLLCDSDKVHLRPNGAYRCNACGFDSKIEETTAGKTQLTQFRDLKNALYEFKEAEAIMKRVIAASMADTLGVFNSSTKYQLLEEANARILAGFDLIRGLLDKHPELFNLPIAGETISHNDKWGDFLLDNPVFDMAIHDKLKESKQRLAHYTTQIESLMNALRDQIAHSHV